MYLQSHLVWKDGEMGSSDSELIIPIDRIPKGVGNRYSGVMVPRSRSGRFLTDQALFATT